MKNYVEGDTIQIMGTLYSIVIGHDDDMKLEVLEV